MNKKQIKIFIKDLKNKMYENKTWKRYSDVFANSQMKLVCTKISLLFIDKKNIEKANFLELETALSQEKNPRMFVNFFEKVVPFFREKYFEFDFLEFGSFMYYIFQISTFYNDTFFKRENIYTYENHPFIDAQKRKHYANWVNSFKKSTLDFNKYITQILKWIL